ncbi:MAG: hypothetical protein FJ387_07575 [Verrucomicrobia bacterium]|nr:hypothetical protein [Verrucomicrobiota bacterium]
MKFRMWLLSAAVTTVLGLAVGRLQAQIAINASDMFNVVGQYYLAHANKVEVDVSGRLGFPGGPQAWDFQSGPQAAVFRFDYVAPADAPAASTFPEASFVERKTDLSDGNQAWMYLAQVPGRGRMNHGFHDPSFSATMPSSPFVPPLLDFPDAISFGDKWSGSTTFDSEISFQDLGGGDDLGGGLLFTIPVRINLAASATADAHGIVSQPGIGFGECLRVNELTQYDIAVDLGLGDGYQTISTQFVRNYYWLRKGRGIAVQITSRQLDTPPPDDFAIAAAFVRMYETNHPDGTVTVPVIRDLRIVLQKDGALLTWTKASGIASYRVESTTDPARPGSWTALQTTTSNFIVDKTANAPGHPIRFYRVVGLAN